MSRPTARVRETTQIRGGYRIRPEEKETAVYLPVEKQTLPMLYFLQMASEGLKIGARGGTTYVAPEKRGYNAPPTPEGELRVRGHAGTRGGSFSKEPAKQLLIALLAEGKTLFECRQRIGRGYSTLRLWMNEPGFKEKLQEVSADAWESIHRELAEKARNTKERIDQATSDALDRVLHLMDNADSEVVQMRCAQDILDRSQETSKIHRVDKRTLTANINVPPEWLLQAAQAAQEEEGQVINGG